VKSLSVIIPALNEEHFIGETLRRLHQAVQNLKSGHNCPVQILVVDNDSKDQTSAVACSYGATVIPEPIRNIARARNAGARVADGEVLLFLDADTLVPPSILSRISAVMSDPLCVGGAVDVDHRPSRPIVRLYLRFWRLLGRLTKMAQGATQFCRRETFSIMGGYDESIYMGEDVDFYWRLGRTARRTGCKVSYIMDVQVVPSARRFDRWPLWKILLWTNPLLITLLRRHKGAWPDWYENAPR
jgi:glycosyltransferase involved in cell wall biosynthesis